MSCDNAILSKFDSFMQKQMMRIILAFLCQAILWISLSISALITIHMHMVERGIEMMRCAVCNPLFVIPCRHAFSMRPNEASTVGT